MPRSSPKKIEAGGSEVTQKDRLVLSMETRLLLRPKVQDGSDVVLEVTREGEDLVSPHERRPLTLISP